MHDIFVTYASEDEGTARRLAHALEACGWSVFWDHAIPPGKSWEEVVGAELAAAPCHLVLWSQDSINSIWVLEEARRGLARGNLVAAYLDDVAPPSGFGGGHPSALIVWDGPRLAADCRLSAGITGLIGQPGATATPPTAEPPRAVSPPPPPPAPAVSAPRPPVSTPAARSTAPATGSPAARAGGEPAPVGNRPPALCLPSPKRAAPARPEHRRRAAVGARGGPALKARLEPGPLRRHRPKGTLDEPELVTIPAGTFRVPATGEARSADVLRIVKAFAIGRYPVTFGEYDRFVIATGQHPPPDRGWGRGRRPIIDVSWEDAVAYTRWLAKQTGKGYRLPTATEWQYVAGVEREVHQWTGTSRDADLSEDEWYWPRYGVMTHPVNALRPNDLGVHDLDGNVWEWVDGGAAGEPASPLCLSLDRRLDFIGFRVALDLD